MKNSNSQPNTVKGFIGMNDARSLLANVSRTVLVRWVKDKKVRAYKMGRKYLFQPDELIEDLKQMQA